MSYQKVRIQVAVFVLFILAGVAVQAQLPQPFSADFTTITPSGTKMTGKWFFSSPRMRMDMTGMPQGKGNSNSPFGGNMSMIIDGANHTSYRLMPQAQMYMEFQANGSRDMEGMKNLELLSKGANPCTSNPDMSCKKVGTETVNGRSCDKWETVDKHGTKSTVWIDQKLVFPIRVQDVGGSLTEFTNVKEGMQDPSLFVVPPGYRKFDASAYAHQK